MDQKLINLYDEYTHKPLSRKEFLSRLAVLTGGMAAALTVLPMLEGNYVQAATIGEEGLITEEITYPGEGTTMRGYLARPDQPGKRGGVLVIHENRGLNPHIRDVTRRLAKAGYVALAPDALSPFGGTPANEDQARNLFPQLERSKNLTNFLKGLVYLRDHPNGNGKTGCIGFCWGGAMANQLAVHDPALNAAISFYGSQADAADVPKIKASLQLHYAGLDERINAGIPAYESALKASGIEYDLYMYEGVNHAFHNDTSPSRYNKEAAQLSWNRALALFSEKLK